MKSLNTNVFFNYKSPDGFSISFEDFSSEDEAKSFFLKWQQSFKKQGYYSSVNYGRIPLNLLADYCQLYQVNVSTDDSDG